MNYFFFMLIVISLTIFQFKKTRKYSIVFILVIFLVLLTMFPKESLSAAVEGINLWIFVVMPSLFPFFIISDLLIALKIPENIARLFTPIARFLFNTSGYGAYAFIMSIFSGYPSGAKITSELVLSHKISEKEGQKILTFSSTSGPLFIIGAVGAGMLKSTAAGYIIFISHILGAVINGFLLKFFNKNQPAAISNRAIIPDKNSYTGNAMSNAISNSLSTSGFIGGYIILFSVLIALLDKINFFSIMTNAIDKFFIKDISWFPGILLKTSLEISNGCKIISSLPAEYELKLILISFIISFSGFSIIGQVASIIGRTRINLKAYIWGKLTHGVISSFLCFIILKINLFQIPASNIKTPNMLSLNIILIESFLALILLLNVLGSIKKTHNYK